MNPSSISANYDRKRKNSTIHSHRTRKVPQRLKTKESLVPTLSSQYWIISWQGKYSHNTRNVSWSMWIRGF
ncbi:hypothetical protein P8452_08563 [Trifolium repens]|nr:hypothetical protein P8452_08563 [Trifolium repens]